MPELACGCGEAFLLEQEKVKEPCLLENRLGEVQIFPCPKGEMKSMHISSFWVLTDATHPKQHHNFNRLYQLSPQWLVWPLSSTQNGAPLLKHMLWSSAVYPCLFWSKSGGQGSSLQNYLGEIILPTLKKSREKERFVCQKHTHKIKATITTSQKKYNLT